MLAQYQLIEAATERQEGEALAALHLRAEQAAERQRLRTVERELAAGERGIEQVHHQAIDCLRILCRQRGAADDLALHQRAGW